MEKFWILVLEFEYEGFEWRCYLEENCHGSFQECIPGVPSLPCDHCIDLITLIAWDVQISKNHIYSWDGLHCDHLPHLLNATKADTSQA